MDSDDEAWAAVVDSDDEEEDLYELDVEEDEQPAPPPPPAPPSGLFYHTPSGATRYAAFDDARGGATPQLVVPDPDVPPISAFPEEFIVLASARGLVCLRDRSTKLYHVANPSTFTEVSLPLPGCEHDRFLVDPEAVITFDDDEEPCPDGGFAHYHVVVAFSIGGGIFGFESFSSRTWQWRASDDIADVEQVLPASGVGALSRAFWRTTVGPILWYDPRTDRRGTIPAPRAVEERLPVWELGEMEGKLCVTCTDERVKEAEVLYLDESPDAGGETVEVADPWALAGQFDGCKLRNREDVALLRSQGCKEVLMFDHQAGIAVAMDLEGRTSRTIAALSGCDAYAKFIPYASSNAEVSTRKLKSNKRCHAT